MKTRIYLTLLLMVVAFFTFGQTSATFNNLDIRATTKLRGLIYPFGASAKSPMNTDDYVVMIEQTSFKMLRVTLDDFKDSLGISGTNYWTFVDSTIDTLYNNQPPDDSVGIILIHHPLELEATTATNGQIKQNGINNPVDKLSKDAMKNV